MPNDHGVQVYEILPNGCLNGVFANVGTSHEIYNEIARKKDKSENSSQDKILGEYYSCYFDVDKIFHECDLKITSTKTVKYIFEWFDKSTGNKIFEGHGWKTNNHQISVTYWSI